MKSTKIIQYTLAELISGLEVSIQGDPNCIILGVSPLQQARSGHIAFLSNSLYKKYLLNTQASAVILAEEDADDCPVNAVITNNPYYIYSKIAAFFVPEGKFSRTGIHPTAIIGEGCEISSSAQLVAYAVLGNNVRVGNNSIVGAGSVIEDDVVIGEGTIIAANAVIGKRCKIGSRCTLSSGVVIGSDGFGFASHKGHWHKVPQLGNVIIGNDVDIGANTTIDRGAVEDTILEDGVKLDNHVQVAHNVKIGAHTIIAGCVGIAGSASIGKNCMIGGGACINGHIQICDNTMITGMTSVSKSIREPGVYSSGIIGAVPNSEFRKNNARFHRLDNLMQRVKTLEAALKNLAERE